MNALLVQAALFCACLTVCNACTCAQNSSARRYCDFDLVVEGRATNMDTEGEGYLAVRVYTIAINRTFKNPADMQNTQTIEIRTSAISSTCGVEFTLQETTVIAATEYDNQFWTNLCAPGGQWAGLTTAHQQALTQPLSDYCAGS